MAIKILHRGALPSERVFEATCSNCETVVEFLQSDGRITHDQRDGDFVTISCPICNNPIHKTV